MTTMEQEQGYWSRSSSARSSVDECGIRRGTMRGEQRVGSVTSLAQSDSKNMGGSPGTLESRLSRMSKAHVSSREPTSLVKLVRDFSDLKDSKMQRIVDMSLSRNKVNKNLIASPFLINPETNEIFYWWDLIIAVALFFVLVITPYEVGFLYDVSTDPQSVLFILNRVVDGIFLLDILLQFFLAFPKGNGIYCYDIHIIRKRYLSTWFVPDVLSALPYDAFSLADVSDAQSMTGLRFIRVFKLGKVYRVLRLSHMFSRIETDYAIAYSRLQLTGYAVACLLVLHWAACGFMLLHFAQAEGEQTWLYHNFQHLIDAGLQPSPQEKYIAALYWSAMTFTTIGYGDIIVTTQVERIFVIAMMIMGATWYGYILSVATVILISGTQRAAAFYGLMEKLNIYMDTCDLPFAAKKRLREHLRYRSHVDIDSDDVKELLKLMSPEIQGEMAVVEGGLWLKQVSYLKDCHSSLAVKLALAMENTIYGKLEMVLEVGSATQNVLVITRGLILHKGRIISNQSESPAMATECLLDSNYIVRCGACAMTYVEVNVLSSVVAHICMRPYASVMHKRNRARHRYIFADDILAYTSAVTILKGGGVRMASWVMSQNHPRVIHYMMTLSKYIMLAHFAPLEYLAFSNAATKIQRNFRAGKIRKKMHHLISAACLLTIRKKAKDHGLDMYQMATLKTFGELSRQMNDIESKVNALVRIGYRSRQDGLKQVVIAKE